MPPDRRARLEEILAQPDYFLHRVDWQNERLVFIETSRETLAAAPFIDGRSPLSGHPAVEVPLREALEAFDQSQNAGGRYIFHVSFCGSTLLARLLDVPGTSIVYREPQALVDLADWRAVQRLDTAESLLFAPALRLVAGQFQKSWAGEQAVVKPSNWVNSLAPELVEREGSRFVLLDLPMRDFLLAVFRGGRDRMVYCVRFLSHMQTAYPDYDPLAAEASSLGGDAYDAIARLCLLALHLQQRTFDAIDPARACRMRYPELVGAPEKQAERAAGLLDLPISADDLRRNTGLARNVHAKSGGAPFRRSLLDEQNQQIETLYSAHIERAIAWAQRRLPPFAAPPDSLPPSR